MRDTYKFDFYINSQLQLTTHNYASVSMSVPDHAKLARSCLTEINPMLKVLTQPKLLKQFTSATMVWSPRSPLLGKMVNSSVLSKCETLVIQLNGSRIYKHIVCDKMSQ